MRFFKYVLDPRLVQEKIVINSFLRIFIRYTWLVFVLQLVSVSLIIVHSTLFKYSIANVMTYTTCIYALFIIAIISTVNRFVKNNLFLARNFIVMWIFLGILVLLSSVYIYYFIVAMENTFSAFHVWRVYHQNRLILPHSYYIKMIHHLVRNIVFEVITVIISAVLLCAIVVHNCWSIKFFNLLYTFNSYCYNRNAVNSRYDRAYFFEKAASTYYYRYRKYRTLRLLRPVANLNNIPSTSQYIRRKLVNYVKQKLKYFRFVF